MSSESTGFWVMHLGQTKFFRMSWYDTNVPNVPRPNGALALVNWLTWGQASPGCARYARCVEGSCAHGNWRQHMTHHNVRLASHAATGHALGPGICCGTSVAAGQNAHRGYGYMIHHWETREHPETISHNAEHKIAQVHTSSMCFQYASMFAYFWIFLIFLYFNANSCNTLTAARLRKRQEHQEKLAGAPPLWPTSAERGKKVAEKIETIRARLTS